MKENSSLNFLKGISCITVVLLHCPIYGIIGDGIIYAFRFPVPVFFMISGYFCYYRDLAWIKKSQVKILKLLFFSEALCGIVSFICVDEGVAEQLRKVPLWDHPLRTIFCGTLFNGTLWYLYAMLWTWIILYLIKRFHFVQQSYILIPVLLAVHIVGRLYIQKTDDMDINEWIYAFRSAVMYGIPFVLAGHFLAEKEEWIKYHVSVFKCLFLLLGGGVVMIMEFMVWNCFMDIWFSTVLIAAAMFIFAMQHPDTEIVPVVAGIGKKYSMIIYVSHIPLSRIIARCLKSGMGEALYDRTAPFLILTAALLTAKAADYIRRKLTDMQFMTRGIRRK